MDDEDIMVEYIAAVEEDVGRFLETQNHRISGVEEIIVDDTAAGLDYHVCAYLQQYPITIWPGRHNRSADDGRVFEKMLKSALRPYLNCRTNTDMKAFNRSCIVWIWTCYSDHCTASQASLHSAAAALSGGYRFCGDTGRLSSALCYPSRHGRRQILGI